jgi:SAM-dependent methyltransferase
MTASTSRAYFEDMYRDTRDPWDFETSAYEQRKYALTMDSLPKARYRRAFEPGCSVGVLTALLAQRCDELVASDIIPAALSVADRRLADASHVALQELAIPRDWPAGRFDLVVLSEIAYYFDQSDLESVLRRIVDSTETGAHVVGVHWRGKTDYPLSGDRAHELIHGTTGLIRLVHHIETDFVLGVWERVL